MPREPFEKDLENITDEAYRDIHRRKFADQRSLSSLLLRVLSYVVFFGLIVLGLWLIQVCRTPVS